jgi:hypothetical protein
MHRYLAPSLIGLLAWTGIAATGADAVPATTPAPTTITASAVGAKPESAVLLPVQVLLSNDFRGFYSLLPAADQAKAEAQWKQAQQQAKANGKQADLAEIDQTLARLLAPDALDSLTKEYEPKLNEVNPQDLSQSLKMAAMFVPMMLAQPQPGQTPEQAQAKKLLSDTLAGILTDASTWVLTAGVNDPKKLRGALEHLIAGAKGLGVTQVADLQALSFGDFLGRLAPLIKEAKLAAAVYDLQIDQFLGSITAKAAEPAAGASPDERTLTVTFTAFGKPYSFPVQVMKQGGAWIISPKNTESLNSMRGMMPMGGEGNDAPANGGMH